MSDVLVTLRDGSLWEVGGFERTTDLTNHLALATKNGLDWWLSAFGPLDSKRAEWCFLRGSEVVTVRLGTARD